MRDPGDMNDDIVLYRKIKAVKAGQIERFEINYTPDINLDDILTSHNKNNPKIDHHQGLISNLWVKVRNIEPIAMRAAFIAGPYLLYVDCRSEDYNEHENCFITANQPTFESQLQPGKSFYSELSCNLLKPNYKWTVDVISQMIFNSALEINFEIVIGTSKQVLHEDEKPVASLANANLVVNNFDTFDLWNLPIPKPDKPIHLVILTHGLHSNVSADMLYLKESIDNFNNNDNIVVKGFFGNICKTERGIKYLGSRVAEFIIDLIVNHDMFSNGKVTKISFIGHSLGGLVQTFAIAYLANNFPWFFKTITPINFITLASPLLGASNENPIYINLALLAGIVGKTGQDLSLRYNEYNSQPLLLLLPSGPTHKILKKFVRRTIYANIMNDGVVPLRTSALLFLDHRGLSSILTDKEMSNRHIGDREVDKIPDEGGKNSNGPPGESSYQSMLPQPIQMILAKFMPQKQVTESTEPQAKRPSLDVTESELELDDDSHSKSLLKQIKGLHKSNLMETVQSLILPPLPSMKFIANPEERDNTIIYEKIYHEDDLPPKDQDNERNNRNDIDLDEGLRKRILSSIDYQEFENIEEEIAREYHKNMTWKKVLVKLKPDAHNNIIVRRRFANAYGWPVIKHLIECHFSDDEVSTGHYKLNIGINQTEDSLDEIGLGNLLSRELIKKQNKTIDETDHHKWINSKDDSLFAVGPAGFLSDIGEMVVNFRDQWYQNGSFTTVNSEGVTNSEPQATTSSNTTHTIITTTDTKTQGHEGKGDYEDMVKVTGDFI